jgi:lysophospholipase L1-like esterase
MKITLFARFLLFAAAVSGGGLPVAAAPAPASAWRFDFGSGPVATGWTQVLPDLAFTPERGYGFDLGSKVESVDRGGNDPLRGDLVTGAAPFFFSVALPEGDYDVAVTFGDRTAGSTNTVKAESRRLMLERVVTRPGEFVTRLFTVNVRTPAIADRAPVRLKEREQGVLHWDDKLTLEFNGARPALCGLEIMPATNAITVFLLGDSTVTDQPQEPWNSWGQMLPRFFEPGIAIANHAESGESLKSSLSARRVEKVLRSIKPGDYVLIQFGHNDQKDEATNAIAAFQANLTQLVAAVRARGAMPVVIASMERKSGVRSNTLAGYPDAVRAVAREEEVPFINLQRMSQMLYTALGTDLDRAFQDVTHHNAYGSYELARCVAEGLRQNNLPLAQHLTDDLPPFDPRKPDPLAQFAVPASPNRTEAKPDGN